MTHTTQTIEQLFKTIVPLKSQEDQNRNMSELLDIPDYSKCFLQGLRDKYSKVERESVSIVTCTRKSHYIENIFENYQNQIWEKKELIIILNSDDMDINEWEKKAYGYKNVFIYQLPQEKSLGHCYNFSIEKANYDFIATFDDDDYYAPNYLTDLMHAFLYTDADIVGKNTYFIYLEEKEILALRNPSEEYKYLDASSFLDGGKKIVKRKVFDQVQYRDVSNSEDVYFCQDSIQKGFKIFSADKYNLVYLRRTNKDDHTWKEQDDAILQWRCSVIAHTDHYKTSITI
ncbi:glycosyltransferase [Bacillus sp. NPDC094106]|uniref:glycosyltransferase n=1 Tax=Bacillus sp. NPDC094106 TaxID=3363949 RepID=UPI00382492AF